MNARLQRFALANAIDALLPQTQCGKCGYAGCRPYAAAVTDEHAAANRCAPGGHDGAAAIAALVGCEPQPVDPRYGVPGPPAIAVIDEARCIGCTLCIQACPVDAIVGARQLMHTVIADACTGCELCIPPCPVDCIAMTAIAERDAQAKQAAANEARGRFETRNARLARAREEALARKAAQRDLRAKRKKKETIEKAIERARQRLAARRP